MARTYMAGEAAVKLTPNAKSFHHEARREIATVKLHAPVNFKADITGFSAEARNKLKTVQNLRVDVKPRLDMTGFKAKASAEINKGRPLTMKVDVDANLKVDTAKATQNVKTWQQTVTARHPLVIRVELDTWDARAQLLGFRAAQEARPLVIQVDADTSRARSSLRILRLQNSGRGAGGSGGGSGRGRPLYQRARSAAMVGGTVFAPIATQASVGGLTAVAGAASQAAGALGLLPALAVSAGAGFAALGVGLSGVSGAFEALAKEAEASKKATDNSRELANAARGVTQAERGIIRAERDLARAHEDVEKAQKDLNNERKMAVRRLRDMNDELRLAPLNEREAALAIKEAQRALREAYQSGDSLEIEGAKINLDKSKIDYDILIKKNQDLHNDTMAANKAGIEGDEQVVAAKEQVKDAHDGVRDAQEGIIEANERLTAALESQADAMKGNTEAADEAAAAMAKLAPSAQSFVLAMRELGPQWTDLRKAVQQNLFSGMATDVSNLAHQQLPVLKEGLAGIASMLNRGMRDSLSVFSSASAVEDFNETLGNTQLMWAGLADTAKPLSQAWIDLSTVGSRFMPRMGQWAADNANEFGDWIAKMRESGQMEAFFDKSIEVAKQLGRILGNIGHVLGDIFSAGNEAGAGILNTWEQATAGLRAFTESVEGQEALKEFFIGVREATAALMPILTIVAKTIFDTIGPALTDLVIGMGPGLVMAFEGLRAGLQAIAPIMEPLGRIIGGVFLELGGVMQVLGPVIAETIQALMPAIGPLAAVLAEIIKGLAPILPFLAELVSQIIVAIAPAFLALVTALQPVIEMLILALMPVLPIIADLFGMLAGVIGDALVMVIEALAPHLPILIEAFVGLVQAILPLLPVLIDLVMRMLPGLIDAFLSVLPVVLQVLDILTDLVNWLVPVLIPVIMWLGDRVEWVFGKIGQFIDFVVREHVRPALDRLEEGLQKLGNFFNWLWFDVALPVWNWIKDKIADVSAAIGTTLDILGGAVEGVGSTFDRIVEGIGEAWGKLKDYAAVPINWVIDVVINGTLKNAWNALADILPGVDTWDGVPRVEFRADGGYISGKGGPRDDMVPAMLSNGEYVLKAAAVDRLGVGTLDRLNNGMELPSDGPIRRYANGGIVQPGVEITSDIQRVMWDSIRQAFPNIVLTSATRYADVGSGYDNHMAGRALDLSPVPAAARWIHDLNATQPVEELIHWPLDGWQNLKAGSPLNYGSPTNEQHMDHLHWAMAQMLATDGKLVSMDGGNSGGGGGVRKWIADKLTGPVRGAIDSLPDWGPSRFAQLPKTWMNSVLDSVVEFMSGQNAGGTSGGSFDMIPGTGPVADQVQQVFGEWGWGEGAQWDATQWIIGRESSWDPLATNASSGAFGLFQFNPSSGTMQEYLPDRNPNPAIQAEAGRRYIKDRYGDPIAAKAFWEGNGYYDQGGIASGKGMMPKNTLEPERVLSPAQTRAFEALIPFLQFLLPGLQALAALDPVGTEPVPVDVQRLDGEDLAGANMPVTADVDGRDVTTGVIHGQPLQGAAIDNETGEYLPAQNDPTVGDYSAAADVPKWWESRSWKVGKSIGSSLGFGQQLDKVQTLAPLLDSIGTEAISMAPAWIAAASGDPTQLAAKVAETSLAWGEKTTSDFANFIPENAGGIVESVLSGLGTPLIGTVNTGMSRDQLVSTMEDVQNRQARRTKAGRRK